MTEEQKIKCEEIINSYEEKYKKEFEEINTLGFGIYGEHSNPIPRMFGIMPIGLSFFEFQFQTEESYMKWLIFLEKSNYIAGENIIEIAASLSNIFNKNMDKEEAEKLLFVKADIKEELIETYGLPPYHYYATEEFGNIKVLYDDLHKNSEDIFKYKYNTTIENIGWAIANYFDSKENNNNQNEENKNFNNENKINNVVENTAKEKIMSKEEQYKKCEEIINSYKAQIGNINFIVPNSIISLNASLNVSKNSPNITLFTIPEYISIITSMTVSLAKVFNKDITKKELEKIILDLKKDLKENPDSEKYKDFESMCRSIVEKLDDELKLNLLILGQTGVGKSSLLNALAGKKLFKTADDKEGGEKVKPTTPAEIFLEPVEIDGKKVNIYDSWGIERDKAEDWKKLIDNKLKERSIDKDIKDWFHSVTFCIGAGKDGIEPFEKEIIKKFLNEKYNVIVALTQADYMALEDKEENDKFIELIKNKTGVNMVIPISANPKKSMIMTETPKPFGLEEYKAAILVSWEKIFIDRIPLHIIEKLKKDIEKAKDNAPNYKPKDDDDLKKLAKEIDEYFINIINKKLSIHIKESFEKYNKITENIITINTNIDISNFYSKKNIDPNTYIYDLHGFNLLYIFKHVRDLVIYLQVKSDIDKYINDFIDKRVEEAIKYISKKSFEDKIKKIIIDNLEK